ncbi:MAG: glycosyltransferase family 9 protein [Deltaproteobacteria bacterium]
MMTWEKTRNILCVRLDNAGDVLMTVPAVRALKAKGRSLTLLTSAPGASVCGMIPEIDDVIVYDAPWVKSTPPRPDPRPDLDMVKKISRRSFDASVIFTVYSQNPLPAAMLCYLSGIPLRMAYCRENPYQLLTHWIPDPEPARFIRHEVERQIALVRETGARCSDDRIRICVPDTELSRARDLLRGKGIVPGERWALVHPGASAPSRRYPADRFARVCDMLASRMSFILTGSREETGLVESVRGSTRAKAFSFAGKTDMRLLAALVALAPLVISNNTCTVHLASAVGTPVVDLYALTNPQHSPWKTPHRVLSADVDCKYCYKSVCPLGHNNCLRLIAPETVADAACELLEGRKCTLSE